MHMYYLAIQQHPACAERLVNTHISVNIIIFFVYCASTKNLPDLFSKVFSSYTHSLLIILSSIIPSLHNSRLPSRLGL